MSETNFIKNHYYKFAKKNTKYIEEVDCYIEEYKNDKKFQISNIWALIISLASVLLVGISTNYSIKTSIITLLFPKVMELYEKENQISLKELDNFEIPDISKEISDFLVVILFTCTFISIILCMYNYFKQQRLAGFYEYKRELIKNKYKDTDKSTDL
ncbi:hypothetical protein ACHCPG_000729 [Enterococcus hirae]|uniref:hypothetical protein n=1 Tax=Enterococcus hirae TaxID=1354 RepID=UPI000BBBA47B|nr:hypothetical protein [Enterococcus hirae]PCE08877.1 hypothetical protein CKY13_02100 [Enterococcus hirae]